MRTFVVTLALLTVAADYPPLPPLDPPPAADRIQRAMRLMATSSPQRRHTVRVLFYGQSITGQAWVKIVADDLRRRFPDADLVIENRAIGGFASQLLVKTAETDLYPFQPDLLVFHVYGAHNTYEDIIRRTRERTCADILMMNDHVTKPEDFDEQTDPAKLRPHGPIWNAFMNHKFLPEVAAKYGAQLCDQRSIWKNYLKANDLEPKQLLRDNVHLNDHGCFLMAEIVKAHLRHDPAVTADDGRVKDFPASAATIDGDTVTFEFDGNRVDVLAKPGESTPASVRIDGRKPSEIAEVYARTRTTPYPNSIWPCLLNVGGDTAPVAETWTLKLTDISDDLKSFRFALSGTVTGPDGEGESGQKFRSDSGRVTIDPADWNFDYALKVFGKRIDKEFVIQWKIQPQVADEWAAKSAVSTVAQGLPNGRHKLTLSGPAARRVEGFRVYQPAAAASK